MPDLHEILPVTTDVVDEYQVLSPEASSDVAEAIALAGTFKVLKISSSLEVMETAEGGQFVTRDYSQRAVNIIGRKTGVEFTEAWAIMHEMYGRAEIDIVPSFVIDHGPEEKEKRLTVVSAYLPEATPLGEAAEQPKLELVFKLGKLLHDRRRYAPAQEALRPDMFHATNASEQADILLTDVDPFVVNTLMISRGGPVEQIKDRAQRDYILKIGDLIWDHWFEGDEAGRENATRLFIYGLSEQMHVFMGLTEANLAFNEMVERGNGFRNHVETRQVNLRAQV